MKTVLKQIFLLGMISTQVVNASAANFDLYQNIKSTELNLSDLDVPAGRSIPGWAETNSIAYQLPNSAIGIPGMENEPDVLSRSRLSVAQLLQQAVEDAKSLPVGQKIQSYLNQIGVILGEGLPASEKVHVSNSVSILLNRSRDIVNGTLPVAGYNTESVAYYYANFLAATFDKALKINQLESQIMCNPIYRGCVSAKTAGRHIHLAEFGVDYAYMLWQAQADARISDGAAAIILVKLLGYLGMDFNMDLRRRESELFEVTTTIVQIQKQDLHYKSIIAAIQEGKEPQRVNLSGLRGKVGRFFTPGNFLHLPTRLNQLKQKGF